MFGTLSRWLVDWVSQGRLSGTREPLRSRPALETLESRDPVATLYGLLSNQTLVRFNSATPGNLTMIAAISLPTAQASDQIVGIDFRPSNGLLYALGYNSGGNSSDLFTINPVTGKATLVGTTGVAFTGTPTGFGFSVDPVADDIRVVTNTGDNVTINPATGTGTKQTSITNTNLQIGAITYSQHFTGATQTTLYAYDFSDSGTPANDNSLVTSGSIDGTPNSPNSGIVSSPTLGNILPSSQTVSLVDLDLKIQSQGTTDVAYGDFTLQNEKSALYTVNLSTGASKLVGAFELANGVSMLKIAAPPVATTLQVSAPSVINSDFGSQTFQVTVTALDQNSNVVDGFADVVGFSSSSAGHKGLPANFAFTPGNTAPGNAGTHTFNVTLNGVGEQTVTVRDFSDPSVPPVTYSVLNLFGFRITS